MKYLLVVFTIGLMSCSSKNLAIASTSKYEEQVRVCAVKFEDVAQVKLPKDIDRAYLHEGKDISDILFTHGSVGTFSDRSEDYQSFVACRVENHKPYKVLRLKYLYDDLLPVVDDVKNDLNIYESTVLEVLLLKKGTGFEFFQQQIFSEERLAR
ncbi:hypothetical protein [Shewanella sp. 8A]|uniref:hypothetical protein n=1 Tax=Shewanella sp. 8A TaxID=2943323 RepID=UPI00201AA648|nr:hypothetical protein [Shewanella sp. 8A]